MTARPATRPAAPRGGWRVQGAAPARPAQRRPEVRSRRRDHLDPGAVSPGGVEAQQPRVQQSTAAACLAEQRIPLDRMADPGQVCPDLVPPPGDRADRDQRVLAVAPYPDERGARGVDPDVAEHLIGRHRPGGTGLVEDDRGAVGGHPDPVLAPDAERQLDGAALGEAGGAGDREVELADRAVVELAGQVAVVAEFLGQQQGTGRHLVDPVCGIELLACLLRQAHQVGVVPFAHHGQAGLVQHQGGVILVADTAVPDLRPAAHRPTVPTRAGGAPCRPVCAGTPGGARSCFDLPLPA